MRGVKLHIWGDFACFTRPEMKVERVSYDIITPSAARGILSAIYWKPGFNWVIKCIHVLKPIRFAQIRRNELKSKMITPSKSVMNGPDKAFLGQLIEDDRTQRSSTVLRDVGYVIEAEVDLVETDNENNCVAKHLEMFKRRASKGQCFHQPCLGTREFFAHFELIDEGQPIPPCEIPQEQKNRILGWMLHDMTYTEDKQGKCVCAHTGKKLSVTPHFFLAEMRNGIVEIPKLEVTKS